MGFCDTYILTIRSLTSLISPIKRFLSKTNRLPNMFPKFVKTTKLPSIFYFLIDFNYIKHLLCGVIQDFYFSY